MAPGWCCRPGSDRVVEPIARRLGLGSMTLGAGEVPRRIGQTRADSRAQEVNHDGAHPDRARHAPAYAPGRNVPGAIKLASNELSFPTLPSIAAAIADAVVHQSAGINRYPDNGAQTLVDRARRAHRRPGNTCHRRQRVGRAVPATGAGGRGRGRRGAVRLALVRGVPDRHADHRRHLGAGAGHTEHELDLPALAAAITPATRLIFVCTPNNPTGTAVRRSDLVAFWTPFRTTCWSSSTRPTAISIPPPTPRTASSSP